KAKSLGWVVIAFGAVVLAGFAGCGFEIVDTGHRGVRTTFGKVDSESLPEGLYFYNPLTSTIIEIDVRETKWDDSTIAYTKDVQSVKVSYAINYHPEPTKVHELYKTVGRDWANKLVPQVVLGNIKEVIGQHEAVKLVSDRHTATKRMLE